MVNFAVPAALITGFLIAVLPGEKAIGMLRRLNARQNISEDAPAAHKAKQGTPTMGGLLILVSITITTLLYIAFSELGSHRHPAEDWALLPILLVTLAFGAIGFTDDYLSAKRGKNLGLRAREKLAAQLVAGSVFLGWMFLTAHPGLTTFVEVIPASLSETGLFRAFGITGPIAFDLHMLYYPLGLLYMVGLSNATNITDGLDGLSSGITIVMSLASSALVYAMRPDLGIFCAALAGAIAGFLWWNAYPARVFMGDTCSLALGAGLAAVSMAGKQEVGVIIASSVCWAELLSVMVQVTVFKIRKKKRGLEYAQKNRVFKRTPLHHHFEECGWKEMHVVLRFWIAAGIVGAISLLWMRG